MPKNAGQRHFLRINLFSIYVKSEVHIILFAGKVYRDCRGLQDKGISIIIYFDQLVIKPEYRDLLRQHVEILLARPKDSGTLDGNADKRCSGEYNLAIGNKRAYAVKAQLTLLGIAVS